MDIVTQGLLGASLAQSAADRSQLRRATFVGLFAGILADADFFIRSATDPLLNLEYHRHFSHSLFFIPIGALIASLLLWPFMRRRLSVGRLYLYALLGFSMSGFLDACTSYGTHLLWPLSEQRVAWQIIAIVDPVFSLLLLGFLLLALWRRKAGLARAGLLLAALYLAFGFVQHNRAAQVAMELAAERGHEVERALVKPTLGNLLLWRSVYQAEGLYHVDALRVGLLSDSRVFPGGSLEVFQSKRDLPGLPGSSVLAEDIRRFARFSNDYLALHPRHSHILGDVRFANSPDGLEPLWGIEMDPGRPDRHAEYNFYRDMSPQRRQHFLDMLLGKSPLDKPNNISK